MRRLLAIFAIVLVSTAVYLALPDLLPDAWSVSPSPADVTAAPKDREGNLPSDRLPSAGELPMVRLPATHGSVVPPSVRGFLVQRGQPLRDCSVQVIQNCSLLNERVLRTTIVDPDGSFLADRLQPGNFAVRVTGSGVPLELEPWRITLAVDQEVDLGELEVPIPAALHGRVVDAQGQPIADTLVFRARHRGFGTQWFRRDLPVDAPEADPYVRTDAAGSYRFDQLAPGEHNLLAEHPDFPEASASITLAAGAIEQIPDFVLQPGRELHGTVRDETSAPIAGASVAPHAFMQGPNMRRAATTAADGSFTLRALHQDLGLTIVAEGFDEFELRQVDWQQQPGSFVLRRQPALVGTITGQGDADVRLVIEAALGSSRSPELAAYRLLHVPLPVDPDGGFRIVGLPAGDYTIEAAAPRVGRSPTQKISLPRSDPVTLAIVRGDAVAVTVRDDQGVPVADAELVLDERIREYPSLYQADDPGLALRVTGSLAPAVAARTDGDGHASIVVPRGDPLAIGALCAGHLPAAAAFPAGHVPSAVELVMLRAGVMLGRVDDASGRAHYSLTVSAWPAGSDATKSTVTLTVDASGAFRSGPLAPGKWQVALHRYDMTWEDKTSSRPAAALPLLGGGIDVRTATTVTVPAAGTVEVALRALALSTIEGRVLANGAPIAGVAVFAVPSSIAIPDKAATDAAFHPAGLDGPAAHHFLPHMTTATDGSYRMLVVAPGDYDLRVRHPRQAVASPPTKVHVAGHGEHLTVDCSLATGCVRGHFDTIGNLAADARPEVAYLYPIGAAAIDPFLWVDLARSDASDRWHATLAANGGFEFVFVPPGDYVLRLVTRWEKITLQQVVRGDGGVQDLGDLRAPRTTTATVPVEMPANESLGAWLRVVLPGMPDGAFACTVLLDKGRLPWSELPPGHYRVQFFTPFDFNGQWGASGTPRGEPVDVELRADGSTEPANLQVR